MGHDHRHGHHHHNHSHGANKQALKISFIIIAGYMIVEAIGGFLTNSLALLSDAGHMFSDAVSLGVGLLAFTVGEKVADYSRTYGYKRFEILAAVFNGMTLILIALYIFYEAFHRFLRPPEVATTGMLIIGIIGLFVNILVAWILMRKGDTSDNLNMRAAYLHVISDMLGSIGAVIAALLMMFFGWGIADPIASVVVAALVLRSGYHVSKESFHVLMEGTPRDINIEDVIATIENTPEVISMHDLHVWSITSGQNALSCHIVVDQDLSIKECQILLHLIEDKLKHKGIGHVTIQVESADNSHGDSIICATEKHHHPVSSH